MIVGAGVVGLAHAVEAVARGLTVTVLERDGCAVGASVRNFGHGCITAQTGDASAYARRAREVWLRLGRAAGFDVTECGTVVVARSVEERAALEELALDRDGDVELLDPAAVSARVPVRSAGVHGGAFLPLDLRIDQRRAVGAIGTWLAAQPGVDVRFGTAVTGIGGTGGTGGETVVRTGRGEFRARHALVCAGHDLDRMYPALADEAGLRRCVLQMLEVRTAGRVTIGPAVLTGSSMLRYPALARTAGAAALRERWSTERPELLDAVVNHMLTQLPDGNLVVGDTHRYGRTPDPWSEEALDELLLAETRALLDTGPLTVVRRWQGVYADAPGEFLIRTAGPGTTAVAVTSGIGMTTAFGLAPAVLDTVTL